MGRKLDSTYYARMHPIPRHPVANALAQRCAEFLPDITLEIINVSVGGGDITVPHGQVVLLYCYLPPHSDALILYHSTVHTTQRIVGHPV